MKNKKLASAIILPLMVASMGMAHAGSGDECCTATATVKGLLNNLCELSLNGGNTITTIDVNTGSLGAALTPSFKLVSNDKHKVDLTAEVESASGDRDALFTKSGSHYLTLGNTSIKPTSAAITNCQGASPVAASNQEVIAYQIVSVTADNGATAPVFSGVSPHRYETDTQAGTTIVTLTTGTAAEAGTYSFGTDASGAYKAEVTLTAFEI